MLPRVVCLHYARTSCLAANLLNLHAREVVSEVAIAGSSWHPSHFKSRNDIKGTVTYVTLASAFTIPATAKLCDFNLMALDRQQFKCPRISNNPELPWRLCRGEFRFGIPPVQSEWSKSPLAFGGAWLVGRPVISKSFLGSNH